MRQAAQLYVGDHDFRNFCKMDAVNVANFRRVVLSVDIQQSPQASPSGPSPYELYEFTVCGYAFLWHQVRCMVEVLFRVGRGEETPDVVAKLLDPATFARGKPVYPLASELPLVLWECGFEDVEWRHSEEAMRWIDDVFSSRWREQAMRYGLAQAFRAGLDQSIMGAGAAGAKVSAWAEHKKSVRLSVRKTGPKLLDAPRERTHHTTHPTTHTHRTYRVASENYEDKLASMSDKKRAQFEAKRQATAGDDDE